MDSQKLQTNQFTSDHYVDSYTYILQPWKFTIYFVQLFGILFHWLLNIFKLS